MNIEILYSYIFGVMVGIIICHLNYKLKKSKDKRFEVLKK